MINGPERRYEGRGEIYSSIDNGGYNFFDLPDADGILSIMTEAVMEHKIDLGFPDATDASLTVHWVNIMYKGSGVVIHDHLSDTDDNSKKVVAILYLQAPENSAKLVTVTDNIETPIEVATGDFLIHDVEMLHYVSEHKSDIPRICIATEFLFK
jgi:hypothetical protein